jgi:hypothetical protein
LVYDEEIHDILDNLLPYPVYMVRYPFLYSSSGQLVNIVKVKSDPKDMSLSIPTAFLPGANGDYDGDEVSCGLIFNEDLLKNMASTDLSYNLLDVNESYSFDGSASIASPTIQMLYESTFDEDKRLGLL